MQERLDKFTSDFHSGKESMIIISGNADSDDIKASAHCSGIFCAEAAIMLIERLDEPLRKAVIDSIIHR